MNNKQLYYRLLSVICIVLAWITYTAYNIPGFKEAGTFKVIYWVWLGMAVIYILIAGRARD